VEVSEVMRQEVATVAPDDPIAEVARVLRRHGSSAALVLEGDRPVGIFTERDMVQAVVEGDDLATAPVRLRMSTDLETITPDATVQSAHERMARHSIRHLPVLEDGRLVGMVELDTQLVRDALAPLAPLVTQQSAAGIIVGFRGPWADGPPPEALVIDAPPLERFRLRELRHLVAIYVVLLVTMARALAGWAVRRRGRSFPQAASEGLVDAFIALGPSFVKVGQLVASSPGVFPEPLATAAMRCLYNVPPFPGHEARRLIEEDLGRPVPQLFKSFDDIPLASASIAQVHACVLPDGREAVIKLHRPNIAERMNLDLRIQYRLAKLAERTELGRRLSLLSMVRDMHATANQELNAALEAHRQTLFRNNVGAFGDNKWITAPEVYWNYCGPRAICMERMYGVPIDQFDVVRRQGLDGELMIRRGIKVGLEAAVMHGPFHGDVHAGNIWVLADGRAAFLDFGLMGELPPPWRQHLRNMFFTLMIDGDWTRIVRGYKDLGVISEDIGSDEEIAMRLKLVMDPMFDLAAASVSLGDAFKMNLQLAQQMGARLPQELMLVAKQVFYFERYVKAMAPDYTMARDLFLMKNVFPEAVAAKAAELGVELPE
jgi:predicted unusual protein kinase regulating ubiquinone biosynthesis (AarF/ABC1/UbiB family)/predicted transcriptional regulator